MQIPITIEALRDPCLFILQTRYFVPSHHSERCNTSEYLAAVISLYVAGVIELAIEVALVCISLRGVHAPTNPPMHARTHVCTHSVTLLC